MEQYVAELIGQGLLDEQFTQLLQLQDEGSPGFVSEVVNLFFEDTESKIVKIGQALSTQPCPYHELDGMVHQLKGSSASIGACQLSSLCIRMRERCQAQDVGGCQALLMELQQAFVLLKGRLMPFLG
jgi:histidine-containing phosphotransfer protein